MCVHSLPSCHHLHQPHSPQPVFVLICKNGNSAKKPILWGQRGWVEFRSDTMCVILGTFLINFPKPWFLCNIVIIVPINMIISHNVMVVEINQWCILKHLSLWDVCYLCLLWMRFPHIIFYVWYTYILYLVVAGIKESYSFVNPHPATLLNSFIYC